MESVREILQWLDAEPTVARFSAAAGKLKRLENTDLPEARLAILRNVSLEPALPYLTVKCYQAGIRPAIYLGQYDNVEQDVLDSHSPLYEFRPEIVVIALRLHGLVSKLVYRYMELTPEDVNAMIEGVVQRLNAIVRGLKERSGALVVVQNFELCPVSINGILDGRSQQGQQNAIRRLNSRVVDTIGAAENTYVLDFEHLLAKVGYDAGLDDRYWHIGRAPYGPATQKALATEYVKFARALKGKSKKCLVLDCDNTLWGGVIGEDGLKGIALGSTHPGSAFVDFQTAILDLYHQGILLAICSKNNEADALEVFQRHPDCVLKADHFVCKKINWNDKASNIREIATELNIGLDSLVYVDDSKFECTLIREQLPEVTVVELPPDPTRYRRMLQELGLFDRLTLGDEDRRRGAMYLAEAKRKSLQTSSGSLDDYLRSLQMVLTIGLADSFTIPRIAQLTQKTNQFNLTTRRYSEGDIGRMVADGAWDVYYAQLEDRFDDSGIIAVALVRYDGDAADIDTLLMSCRVIGRGVEAAFLAHIVEQATARGASRVTAQYIKTAKNGLVANFLPDHGFQPVGDEGRWELTLPAPAAAPRWFQTIRVKGKDGSNTEVSCQA